MIRAYDEILLNTACDLLGRMLDFAAHSMHIDPESMMGLFTASCTASEFERGDIGLITGMSGVELTYKVLDRSGIEYERRSQRLSASLSGEYHSGYAIAFLQWEQNISFEEIISHLSISELPELYQEHKTELLEKLPWDISESDRSDALYALGHKFIAAVSDIYHSSNQSHVSNSRLKDIRIKSGLSQSQLAKASGVPLRTIQQYEQRQKSINKARAEYLIMLSSALNCDAAVLLERE